MCSFGVDSEKGRGGFGTAGQEPQKVDELLVGVRDGRARDPPAVGELEEDFLTADDVDVLDSVVVDEGLQPTEPEHGVEDRVREGVLLHRGPRAAPGGDGVGDVLLEQVVDDRTPVGLLEGFVHHRSRDR